MKHDKTCQECEGWGYWEYPTIARIVKVPCKKCGGTGKIKGEEDAKAQS